MTQKRMITSASDESRAGIVLHVELKREKVPDFYEFPFNLPWVKGLERIPLHPEVTVLVGENGAGKSTLLEAVAVASGLNAEGGSKNLQFQTRSSHSDLHTFLRVARSKPIRDGYFLRAESFFNVATRIEELDQEPGFSPPIIDSYGGRSLHEQSHGESFLALLSHRFSAGGFYVLDEPEAALSIQNQLTALVRIHSLAQQGAQFLLATHSPILMAYPNAYVYEVGASGIHRTEFDSIEHVKVMRRFMDNPTAVIQGLLKGWPDA
jgi:predicted ATPase